MYNIVTKLKIFFLIVGDAFLLYFALWLTLLVRYLKPVNMQMWNKHWLPFSAVFLIWLVIFFINKLYDLAVARNNVRFYSLLLSSLLWCAGVGFAFFYITTAGISPKTILIIQLVIFGVLFVAWRRLFNVMIKSKRLVETILFIGLSKETVELAQEINENPQLGLRALGIVDVGESGITSIQLSGVEIIQDENKVKDFITANKIKTVVMSGEAVNSQLIINELYKALDLKMNILDLPTFAEKFTGKILINTIGRMWFLENFKESNRQMYEITKRVTDVFFSFLLLVIFLVFLPLIYAVISLTSAGSGFFMQQRTGKNGKKFMAVKFRSMYKDAEKNGPQWAEKNDPRVTGIGRFLRKTRIDEIPQLINVLRGEMSLVGPRPERPEFIDKLKKIVPFYETRLLIKPGITGWAQINFPYGSSYDDAAEKLQYDLYYLKNRSFVLDLSIALKTIKTVLSGGGQ